MAQSTGVVLAAGAFALGDVIISGTYTPQLGVRLVAGTVAAAFVSAGLDKVVPGFGTGVGVVLLAGAVLGNGPRIASKLFPPAPVGLASGISPAPSTRPGPDAPTRK